MRRFLVPCILLSILAVPLGALEAWADEFAWLTHIGGAGDDYGTALVVDDDGNSYLTGIFAGAVDFGPYHLISEGDAESFVAKLDSNGTVQWAMRMGGATTNIARDGGGNLYAVGSIWTTAHIGPYTLTPKGSDDIFVAKLDSNGTVQWAMSMGGPESDVGMGIVVGQQNEAYVTGYFSRTASFGEHDLMSKGQEDIFVAKLDSNNGTVQWAMRMGGPGFDYCQPSALDRLGNFYLAGSFAGTADFGPYDLTSAGFTNIFVAKLDSNGTVQWAMRMGGNGYARAQGIALDKTNNVYVSGDFSAAGDFGRYHLTPEGDSDVFVAKLNGNGNVRWAMRMGGNQPDAGYRIMTDGNGNAYAIGILNGLAHFGSYSLTSAGSWDIFFVKLNKNGDVQSAMRMGSSNIDQIYHVATDGSGNAYITGYYYDKADFGPYIL